MGDSALVSVILLLLFGTALQVSGQTAPLDDGATSQSPAEEPLPPLETPGQRVTLRTPQAPAVDSGERPAVPSEGLLDNLEPPPTTELSETVSGSQSEPTRLSQLPPLPLLAPSGFDGRGTSSLWLDSLTDGLSLGSSFSAIYDSNLSLGARSTDRRGRHKDDFIFSFAPFINYRTVGSDWFFSIGGGLDYSEYVNNSEDSGLGYNGNVAAGYAGAKFNLNTSFNYSFDRGANRYAGSSFVEQHRFAAAAGWGYKITSKTSLDGSFSYAWSEPDGDSDSFHRTDTLGARASAMWKATPLLRVGPGIAYTRSSGSAHSTRETWGPTLTADYRLGAKLSLNATVSLDFVEYDGTDAGDDETVSAGVQLTYQASSLWGANFSFYRNTFADGFNAGMYRESTGVRAGYHRKIRRATLNAGISYETSETSGATAARQDWSQDYVSADVSVGMPFLKYWNGSVFFQWRDESGRYSGDGYRTGVTLSLAF